MTQTIPHYDVIIIGAGSVGTPAAYYFSKAGFKTLVLDPLPSVGQGSSKKAIGGVRATHSDPAKIRLCLRSLEIFSTWKEETGDDIEWYQGGYCFVAYGEREEKILKDLLIKQKQFNLNINWHDHDDLLQIAPDLNPNGLIGGTFSPGDGSISPLLCIHSYYTHAIQHGAEFHFDEPVSHITTQSGKVTGVKTTQATYGADIVINAAGAWSKEIGEIGRASCRERV